MFVNTEIFLNWKAECFCEFVKELETKWQFIEIIFFRFNFISPTAIWIQSTKKMYFWKWNQWKQLPVWLLTVKCRIAIKVLFLDLNLCLNVMLKSLLCSFTFIYFLTNWYSDNVWVTQQHERYIVCMSFRFGLSRILFISLNRIKFLK